jgi:hypothetical protein
MEQVTMDTNLIRGNTYSVGDYANHNLEETSACGNEKFVLLGDAWEGSKPGSFSEPAYFANAVKLGDEIVNGEAKVYQVEFEVKNPTAEDASQACDWAEIADYQEVGAVIAMNPRLEEKPHDPQPENNTEHSKKLVIYQAKSECPWKFRSLDEGPEKKPFKEWYQEKYSGTIDKKATLEDIYYKFNRPDRPNGQTMHSLSVSDIVETDGKKFYVDDIGFKEVKIRNNQMKAAKEKTSASAR